MGSCFSAGDSPTPLKTSTDLPQTQLKIQTGSDLSVPLNPYVNQIHEINTKEEFDRLRNETQNMNVLIVCDFYATWCPPCLQIAPILHKWAMHDYRTDVIFMKIDVDQNSDVSDSFLVTVLPTFILFKRGKEVCRFTGADATNLKKEIEEFK